MRLAEVDVETRTREPRFTDYFGSRDPEFCGFQPPDPTCKVRLIILCSPAEAQAFLNMLGSDINPPTRAAAPKDRQLPEQGEPEVVACVVEQPKALVPGFEELERNWPAGPEGRPSGCTGPAVPKPPLGKLLPWCMKCQQRPCIGEGCAERCRLLSRFGFLSSYTARDDAEEKEVHELKVQLAAAGVNTGWEIVAREPQP